MEEKRKMSYLGVGPIFVIVGGIMVYIAKLLSEISLLQNAHFTSIDSLMVVISIFLIVLGFIIWFMGAFISKIDKHISKNQLVTTGIYSIVRHPIYSGWLLGYTGGIIYLNNLYLLILPIILWKILQYLVKHEEANCTKLFGTDYTDYKSKVNCCIPIIHFKR